MNYQGTIRLAVILGLVSGTWGGARAYAADDDFQAAVAANVKQFMNAVAKGDAAAVADIYASDAVILVPNHEMVKGREAIEKFWAEYLHSGIKSVELKTLEAASSGNMGYELGTYSEIGE